MTTPIVPQNNVDARLASAEEPRETGLVRRVRLPLSVRPAGDLVGLVDNVTGEKLGVSARPTTLELTRKFFA